MSDAREPGWLTFEEYVEDTLRRRDQLPPEARDLIPAWVMAQHSEGGQAYVRLVRAVRDAVDAVAEARLDEAESAYLAGRLDELAAHARSLRAAPGEHIWGARMDLQGRGSALPPEMRGLRVDAAHGRVRADVVFGASYVGAGTAAHGGAVALLFDEIMGLAANAGRMPSRTAYLHIDYRAVTPIGADLAVSARIDRVEGRKRFVVGEIRHAVGATEGPGGQVVAEAEGLFVELRSHHA